MGLERLASRCSHTSARANRASVLYGQHPQDSGRWMVALGDDHQCWTGHCNLDRGARLVQKEFRKNEAELDWLIKKLEAKPPFRVSGTAVFLTPDVNSAPTSLMHNLKHNRILHERNIVLSIKTNDVPRVPSRERLKIDRSNETFVKITAHYGFMETPSIPKIFNQCRRKSFNVDLGATSFLFRDGCCDPVQSPRCPSGRRCFSSP